MIAPSREDLLARPPVAPVADRQSDDPGDEDHGGGQEADGGIGQSEGAADVFESHRKHGPVELVDQVQQEQQHQRAEAVLLQLRP